MSSANWTRLLVVLGAILATFPAGAAYAAEGGYVLVDTQRKEEIPDSGPGKRYTLEEFGTTSARLKRFSQNPYGKHEIQEARSIHGWSAPPSLIRPGVDVSMTLSVKVDVLASEFKQESFNSGTQVQVDTDRSGLVFTNHQVEKPVAVRGTPGVGSYPDGRPFSETVAFQAPARHKNLFITITAGGSPGHVHTRYVYNWQDAPEVPVPTHPPSNGGGGEGNDDSGSGAGHASPDIAGTWIHGDAGETWTFTPLGGGKYKAVETGFSGASGVAEVSDGKIHIDYTEGNGRATGTYDVTLAPGGTRGTGVWRNSRGDSGTRPFSKGAGTPPPAAGMTLRSESRQVKAGSTVTVPVWLDHATGVANMNFTLTYDASVARAERVDRGGLIPRNVLFESNPREPGVLRVGFAGSSDLSGTGPVAQILFRAVGRPGATTALTLTITTVSAAGGEKPMVRTVNGMLQILTETGEVPGDGNGSGALDAGDALEALKMSVKLIPEKPVCDLDKDGAVTSTDARLILQKVVGK